MWATTFFFLLGLAQAAPSSSPAPPTLGFVWRGETNRSPHDIRRAGGIWARGFTTSVSSEQLELGSSLFAHVSGGTREYTQYVSTTTSLPVAMTFAVRTSPAEAHEPGYIYRIRTNWAAVDVNLSLQNICPYSWQEEHAFVQGIPWNLIMGWYTITTADLNRILSADDPLGEMGPFTRNDEFRPDATHHSGSQPQLAGLQVPVARRHGPWEAFVGQSAAEHLRRFIRDYSPRTDLSVLRRIDWGAVRLPGHLRAPIVENTATLAHCALAAAVILVSRRRDELRRSIPEGQLIARQDTANPGNDSCARLAAVARAKLEDEAPTVKICDGPHYQGQCKVLKAPAGKCVDVPYEWNDQTVSVLPSVAAGLCKLFVDYECQGDVFESSYPGRDNLNNFLDGHYNHKISSFQCPGVAFSGSETQIERPPTEHEEFQELPGVHVCESDDQGLPCSRFAAPDAECVNLRAPFDRTATWIQPEQDAGSCKFYTRPDCRLGAFERAYPGIDLYREMVHLNDLVKSFRCTWPKRKSGYECDQGRAPVKCTPSLQSPVAPPNEWLPIHGCCTKSIQAEEECCRSQIHWLDRGNGFSDPYIAPEFWYKRCAIGNLTVDVQLAHSFGAGSSDRLFVEIGRNSKFDGGQAHYLLKESPHPGDRLTKHIDLGDAFEKKEVTIDDIKLVRLASREDNGNVGSDEVTVLHMIIKVQCAEVAISAQVRKSPGPLTFWGTKVKPEDWTWNLAPPS